ncbi:MAG: SDR family NAD(P)-dependent oxidoreductase [Rhodospirillales bacterium]|nr:SDR family NAD(P)-dependent oxidoreductase [Rhodospirillales bacterium]
MRAILITGASSGIGEALALRYAAPGVFLALSGRDPGRLAAVAEACRAKGAELAECVLDVADGPAMAAWIESLEARHPLYMVVANAGISAGTGRMTGETADQTRALFAVNLDGVMNTVLPVIEPMRRRGHGQIAILSSLAGFRGMPRAPAYCASKAAVRVWGEGLRGWLAPHGIKVSVICPGFVVSRMTAVNKFPMPFLMKADKAAALIARGLDRNRGRIAFPWPMLLAAWLAAALPDRWVETLVKPLPAKDS